MNHVIRHIEYLVHRHDCVVLPKWGAFIADYQSACYDEALGLMYPPIRELSFSASVDYNDGVLASSIARKEAIPFAQASRIVEEELSSMKHQLALDGEISLGKVGRFISQSGDGVSVIFEPAKAQLNVGSAGFEAFPIKPLLDKVKEEAIKVGRIEAPRRSRLSRLGLRAIKAAAAVAVVVGVSLALLRPSFDRNDNMASLSPVMSQKSSQTSVVPSLDEPHVLNIGVPHEEAEVVECAEVPAEIATAKIVAETSAVEVAAPTAVASQRLNASDRYCLVVASLPSMELAEKYIGENNAYNLGVLAKDCKFRVYVATGNTINEALEGKDFADVATRFADAWVCSMR